MELTDEGAKVAVLGSQVARHLGARVGDRIFLVGETQVHVIGILAPTQTLSDAFVVVPLRTLQAALGVPGLISLAAVEVGQGGDVAQAARALSERVDAEVYLQTEARTVITRLLRSADAVQWALASVALLVAFLSVLTTMTAMGFERRAELGVLRALGLPPVQAAGLVVLDGLLLAGAGGLSGALAAWPVSEGISALTQQRLGVRAAVITPGVLLAVMSVSGGVGALAALPVAWRVCRQPIARAFRSF